MDAVNHKLDSISQSISTDEEPLVLHFPRFDKTEKYILLLVDAMALWASLVIGRMVHLLADDYTLFSEFFSMSGEFGPQRLVSFSVLMTLALASFISAGHFSLRRPFWDELGSVIKILFVLAIVDFIFGFMVDQDFSRVWYLSAWAAAVIIIPISRISIKKVLMRLGGWVRPCVIIGMGRNATDTAHALTSEPLLGYRVGAYMSPYQQWDISAKESIVGSEIPIVQLDKDPVDTIKKMGGPHIFVALESGMLQRHQKLLKTLIRQYSDIYIVPARRGLPLHGMDVLHFFSHEMLLLNARNNLSRIWTKTVKRTFDIMASVFLALVSLPVLLYISWKVSRDGGPIFYVHSRVGGDGKIFGCLKFRTMEINAREALAEYLNSSLELKNQWEHNQKLKDDPRITPFGRKLRNCSLDELPQLWNVLRGEMSLVGPRPITEEEMHRYGDDLDYYLSVQPGITGLWQTSGRNDTDYTSRVALDAWYVRNWSLWYDIVILLKTVKVVLSRKGVY